MDSVEESLKIKRIMGYIPDEPFLYEKLTGNEFLDFIVEMFGLKHEEIQDRRDYLTDKFELTSFADRLTENYSHGMKQRLIFTAAFIHNPKFLVIDEPMVGLDPRGAKLVKRIFRELCDHGITIFMSIHTLEVAEEMCDRIGIIQEGSLVAVGTMDELKQQSGESDSRLESIFFKLTGDEDMQEVISALRL
jgi:ABC-2 type transport system ATP-binding protein